MGQKSNEWLGPDPNLTPTRHKGFCNGKLHPMLLKQMLRNYLVLVILVIHYSKIFFDHCLHQRLSLHNQQMSIIC